MKETVISGAEETVPAPHILADGHLDAVMEDGWVVGWASTQTPGATADLVILIDDMEIGTTLADQFRDDLAKTALPNPACAFWYSIPEQFWDGEHHRIRVRLRETGEEIRNSPLDFRLVSLVPSNAHTDRNLMPNARFSSWPNGLHVEPRDRLVSICEGWFFDYKKGTQPKVSFFPVTLPDAGLEQAYALRIRATEADGSYLRLIVPLSQDLHELSKYRFSCGFRRPSFEGTGALHVEEIFLAGLRNTAVRKLGSIRKKLAPRGTQRVQDIPISVNADESLGEGERCAIVLQLRGEGELTLFSPTLRQTKTPAVEGAYVVGEFEDRKIQDQVEHLNLNEIWLPRHRAVSAKQGVPPRVATQSPFATTLDATPFVQIVIPVFNAAEHVEDAVHSIIQKTSSPFEILLFDDGSDAYAASRASGLSSVDSRIRYYAQDHNLGYTRNINAGLQSTVADFIVLLNSDTIVTDGWIQKLFTAISASPDTAAAGPLSNAASWQSVPRTKAPTGDWIVNNYPGGLSPDDIAGIIDHLSEGAFPEFPLLNGFCTMFRASALAAIGYFDDESFPQGYGEENDVCLRLGKAGYKLRVADNCFVYHKKSKSFGNDRRKILSKQANLTLRAKHPEVDWADIEDRMRTSPVLKDLRRRLIDHLQVENDQIDLTSFSSRLD